MRVCGNFGCVNYFKTWDINHHSTCPYCSKKGT